jgi:hypothetical protein
MPGVLTAWGVALLLAITSVVVTWNVSGPGLALFVGLAVGMFGLRLASGRGRLRRDGGGVGPLAWPGRVRSTQPGLVPRSAGDLGGHEAAPEGERRR